jgi:hypothetical protein
LLNCLSRKLDSTSRGAVNSAASTIKNFRFFRYWALAQGKVRCAAKFDKKPHDFRIMGLILGVTR